MNQFYEWFSPKTLSSQDFFFVICRGPSLRNGRPVLFKNNDILVLPYLESLEQTSGPLHLAIEYGLPVVCSRAPQLKYIVDRYDIGIVTENSKDSALLKAILRLLQNKKDYSESFKNARAENSYHNQVQTILDRID